MSRIFTPSNSLNFMTPFSKTISFFVKNTVGRDFYKSICNKGYLLRNIYFYYDFYFYTLSFTFVKKNILLLNFFLFKNFKSFLNYFYNSSLLGNNFVVADNDYRTYSPFLYLSYSESFLIQYNSFFKRNHFFLKQSFSVVLLKRFFYKTKTTTLVVLNYDEFHKYLPLYSTFNAAMVSFIIPNTRPDLLDFFLFKSSKFFYLEKLLFLAKIYKVYYLAFNINFLKNMLLYKTHYDKINMYLS